MGGDGGTIPGRQDLVKQAKRLKQAHKVSFGRSKVAQWTHCALSNNRLQKPIVIDSLGNLFNKQDIVLTLFNKKIPRQLSHIRKIKRDVININPTMRSDIHSADVDNPDTGGIFQCPITDLIANGKYPFIVLRQCGCLLSEKALKQVPSQTCLICGTLLDIDSETLYARIPVNPMVEIKDTLRELNLRKVREYKLKKKSSKNQQSTDAPLTDTLASAASVTVVAAKVETNDSKDTQESSTKDESRKRKRKMSRAEKEELRREIEKKLESDKAKINPSVLGKRSLPEDVDRTVESQKKKSKVFASLFDDNRRPYNFTGGGRGGI